MFGSSSGPELAPRDGDVAVEDQRGVGAALADESLLQVAVALDVRSFSACMVWNQVHQQPPQTPLPSRCLDSGSIGLGVFRRKFSAA